MLQLVTLSSPWRVKQTPEGEQPVPGGLPLKIEGVSKFFQGRVGDIEALRPIHVEVEAGEFVCLLGPSGCGKSTLLSIIAGLESASSGSIWADGKQVQGSGTDRVCSSRKPLSSPGWTCNTMLSMDYARRVCRPKNVLPSRNALSISCI